MTKIMKKVSFTPLESFSSWHLLRGINPAYCEKRKKFPGVMSSSIRNRTIKGAVWSVLQNSGTQILLFGATLVLARLLPPRDFGIMALANVLIELGQILIGQGLSEALIQRQDLKKEHIHTAFTLILITNFTILGVGLFFPLTSVFPQTHLVPLFHLILLVLFIRVLGNIPMAIMRRQLQFKPLAVWQILSNAAGALTGIWAAVQGAGIYSLVFMPLASRSVFLIGIWRACRWRPSLKISWQHARELKSVSWGMMGISSIQWLENCLDVLLVGTFLGSVSLGYYAIARRLVISITRITANGLGAVSFPALSRIQHDKKWFKDAIGSFVEMNAIVLFPVFIGLALVADSFIPFCFGSRWTPSIPLLQALALMGPVSIFNFPAPLQAIGRSGTALFGMLINTLANLLVFYLTVDYGIERVALAFLTRSWILAPVMPLLIFRYIGFSPKTYFRQIRIPLCATGIMAGSVMLGKKIMDVHFDSFDVLVSSILIGTVVYSACLWFLAPSSLKKMVYYFIFLKKE